MQLSIILVNYKTPSLVIACLTSVFSQKPDIIFDVVVVDNCSDDGSIALIKNAFPGITILSMDYNAGFARANNRAILQSNAEAVLLLNSDTIIEDGAFERAYRQLMESDYLGCGVQLLNKDRTPQISGNFFMKGGLNNLLPLPYLGPFFRFIANQLNIKKTNIPHATSTMEVDWINGAFLMVKKAAIKKAGLLDEDFFLYAEEAEWCSRLRKTGRLCIFGEINIVHLQGETANETFKSSTKGYQNLYDRKGLQIMVSNFLRLRKQFGTAWFIIHLLIFTSAIPVFFFAGVIENIFNLKNPFQHFQQVWGFASNVFRLWSLSGKIISNKPHFYKVL